MMGFKDKNDVEIVAGMRLKHDNGDVETVIKAFGELYIDGTGKSIFPLTEFDMKEFVVCE